MKPRSAIRGSEGRRFEPRRSNVLPPEQKVRLLTGADFWSLYLEPPDAAGEHLQTDTT
jgi:hypothetical protein